MMFFYINNIENIGMGLFFNSSLVKQHFFHPTPILAYGNGMRMNCWDIIT